MLLTNHEEKLQALIHRATTIPNGWSTVNIGTTLDINQFFTTLLKSDLSDQIATADRKTGIISTINRHTIHLNQESR